MEIIILLSSLMHGANNLINVKKHESLDEPPDMPFFRGKNKSITSISGATSMACASHSDSKIHACTELLNQLSKLSDLLSNKCISQEQFDKLQKNILQDLDSF